MEREYTCVHVCGYIRVCMSVERGRDGEREEGRERQREGSKAPDIILAPRLALTSRVRVQIRVYVWGGAPDKTLAPRLALTSPAPLLPAPPLSTPLPPDLSLTNPSSPPVTDPGRDPP
jgi:hypothetical protein